MLIFEGLAPGLPGFWGEGIRGSEHTSGKHFGPLRQALCCLGLRGRGPLTKKLTDQGHGASEVRDVVVSWFRPHMPLNLEAWFPTPPAAPETHTTSPPLSQSTFLSLPVGAEWPCLQGDISSWASYS